MKLPDVLAIQPLTRPPRCTITVPGSKSITNRALILAALAKGKCTLRGALWADDTQVMVDSLQELGFTVDVQPDPAEECNRTIIVEGRGGEIPAESAELYVGNAGTAARFLTALVTRGHGEYRIAGDPRMHERPMGELFRALGIAGEHLPVTIRSVGIKPAKLRVQGEESSQFASALLLIGHEVETKPHAYVEMTRRMLREFKPEYAIEPDLSGASYFVAAGWITGGRVEVAGWPDRSLQIDGEFPKFLPPPAILSRQHDLGDSVMTSAICALFGKQPMVLKDASRMREQECDRIAAMVTELKRVGAKVEEHRDGLTVWPGEKLHGADIETYNDHRMAMCFGVLGLKVPGIRIKNPACVSKTFPNFFEKLEQLRQ
ncbi:MAG: 3-phosphoshikimate 1-carboxyvinyltransferase [Verrucomicrobiota bacterium]